MTTRTMTALIIGGGPAGLAAAEVLSDAGLDVCVYDRMPSVGRKFLMAGRGGLNLTHSEALEAFLPHYGVAQARLAPFIGRFTPSDLVRWAADLGQPSFVGTSGRIFPKSLKASPLLRSWLGRLRAQNVRFQPRHEWRGWDAEGDPVFQIDTGLMVKAVADVVVLALGGASWPRLGSTGAWTHILAERGVSIAPLQPANCGFSVAWSEMFRDRFEGHPLKNVTLSFEGHTSEGEAMITRDGIEGGVVYALSACLRETTRREGRATPTLDLRRDSSIETLTQRLGTARHGQSASTFLRKSAGLLPVSINLLREATGNALPEEAWQLARLIKALPLTLQAPYSIDRAISTAGGLAFDELDDNLMIKRLPGVFAAGEMIDWEAPTGGYLLQGCFSTGFAAATGALSWINRSPL